MQSQFWPLWEFIFTNKSIGQWPSPCSGGHDPEDGRIHPPVKQVYPHALQHSQHHNRRFTVSYNNHLWRDWHRHCSRRCWGGWSGEGSALSGERWGWNIQTWPHPSKHKWGPPKIFEDHGHDYLASNNTSEIEESVDKIGQWKIDGLSYIGDFLCKKLIKEFPF